LHDFDPVLGISHINITNWVFIILLRICIQTKKIEGLNSSCCIVKLLPFPFFQAGMGIWSRSQSARNCIIWPEPLYFFFRSRSGSLST